jgi:hypothetical protein
MIDFVKIPSAIVLVSRRARMQEKRPASELEALLELQAMITIGDMPPSLNQFAQSLGWSRGRLRTAHARWLKVATHAGDATVIPDLPVRS